MSMIPKPGHPIVDGKPIDRYWYDALQRLAGGMVTETRVVEIVQAQTPPPAASATTITPTSGIDVAGNATDGYYIGLRTLFDSGVGAALWKFTRDDFGRVSGTQSATTDDLTEGSTNLYHTTERAQDAVGAAIAAGTGDGVTLTYDDSGNKINAANTDKGSVAVASHVAAADPHPQYTTAPEAAAAAPVQSVNAKTGAVVLSSADVGADPAGTSASAMSAHVSAGNPHPQYVMASSIVGPVPTRIAAGQTYTVPADTQALWTLPIELEAGASIEALGDLVEVN